MQEDETFEKFYAQFSNIFNCSYNLSIPISKEKHIEKIIDGLIYRFHTKVTILESMYNPGQLTINELVGDLQFFKFHHLLPKQDQINVEKGKSLALKSTKDNGHSKYMNAKSLSDDDSNLDKEQMALLAKIFTRFFREKKPLFMGVEKESSSTEVLKSIKVDENSDNEVEKPNKGHLNKI